MTLGVIRRLRRRYHRYRLKRAYGTIVEIETGKSVGFTPLMMVWDRMERDGWIELDKNGITWKRDVLEHVDGGNA